MFESEVRVSVRDDDDDEEEAGKETEGLGMTEPSVASPRGWGTTRGRAAMQGRMMLGKTQQGYIRISWNAVRRRRPCVVKSALQIL